MRADILITAPTTLYRRGWGKKGENEGVTWMRTDNTGNENPGIVTPKSIWERGREGGGGMRGKGRRDKQGFLSRCETTSRFEIQPCKTDLLIGFRTHTPRSRIMHTSPQRAWPLSYGSLTSLTITSKPRSLRPPAAPPPPSHLFPPWSPTSSTPRRRPPAWTLFRIDCLYAHVEFWMTVQSTPACIGYRILSSVY